MMKKYIYLLAVIGAFFTLNSCQEKKNEEAIKYLDSIKALYQQSAYPEALSRIDSIQILFPKAFPEIKEGLALKQEVRKAYDARQIVDCDSLMTVYQPRIDSVKKLFVYQKDKEDTKGTFIPKAVSGGVLTATMLRAGVEEEGPMYIESVYLGGQLHNAIQAKIKDGSLAETKPIDDEGLNFRFSHMGKQYEVIKATKFHDNGLADFIFNNASQPITITLKGKNTTSFALSNVQKKAITDSYNLSKLLLLQDSLMSAKDKASLRIKYVDEQKQKNETLKLEQQKAK
ncbi:hypothetical protein [Dysgonomonas macrotermitis]|uniref:Uncharacterized protein n=1 Tax=Dysgonomonas macrotermitis TaxID=1346286 RepID=A0A1M4TX75_9BACT|nr:hypothetical protein [Dysgonomonas macrotermitis]SHE49060.1 hypothetical protein SAMN05444362_101445 [Dysgonomonas macrotermitis]